MVLSSREWNPHVYQRSVLGVAIAGSVLFGSVAYSPQFPKWARILSSVIAIGNNAIGMATLKQIEALEPDRIADEEVRKELAIRRHLQRLEQPQQPTLMPQSEGNGKTVSDWGDVENQQGVTPFDWTEFRTNRDAFPHIGIAGKTGGGKSWLAEYLASCFDGIVVAISPHWKKGGFTSADLVVAWGRNYGTVEDYEQYKHLSFTEILTGKYNISACAFLVALYHEMNRRYQIDDDQNFVGDSEPEIVVILDEFNAWAGTDGLKEFTFKLLREARKVKIRLIPLVQGTEVKAMGCEGEGQIREQLTWVMIANKAKSYAEQNLSKAKKGTYAYEQALNVCRYISTVKYPAFVGDLSPDSPAVPAEVPDLNEWKKTQPSKANLAGWEGTSTGSLSVQRTNWVEPREPIALQGIHAIEPPPEKWDGNTEIPPSYVAVLVQGIREGLSKNKVLELLNIKKGGSQKYQLISQRYDELKQHIL